MIRMTVSFLVYVGIHIGFDADITALFPEFAVVSMFLERIRRPVHVALPDIIEVVLNIFYVAIPAQTFLVIRRSEGIQIPIPLSRKKSCVYFALQATCQFW